MVGKKIISVCCALMICGCFLCNLMVNACEESVSQNKACKNLTDEFYSASDDTIVCYMDGIAIKKSDVDENGVVKKAVTSKINKVTANTLKSLYSVKSSSNSVITFYSTALNSIPMGITYRCNLNVYPYKNCIVSTHISAPRYGQNNKKLYLSRENAIEYEKGIRTNSAAELISWCSGFLSFIPVVGPFVTMATQMYALPAAARNQLSFDILDITNSGKDVRINTCSSPYGNFTAAFEWNGYLCPLVEVEPNPQYGGTETLESIHIE